MLYRTERFVLWLVTVGLVILVAVQMMMTSEQGWYYLKTVESKFQALIQPEAYQVAEFNLDESVTLKLLNPGSYPEVRVLVNNERAFYFTEPVIQIPCNSGDYLIIDTRGVQEALYFEVVNLSKDITSPWRGQQFRVKNDLEVVPVEINSQNRI